MHKPLAGYIPLKELWEGFNPLGVREGIFVVFRGYIDESFDPGQKIFALACLTLHGKHWMELERLWRLRLNSINRILKKQHRLCISRYHATDCSGRRKEYKGWTLDERDEFVKDLFEVFRIIPVHNVCLDMKLDDLCEVFPEFADHRLDAAYAISTQAMLETLGEDYHKMSGGKGGNSTRITLFHDRTANGKYDATILKAFNATVLRPHFPFKDYFTTIAPLSSDHCIALQPADLVAFEIFKEAEGREEARKMRKSFQALLNLEAFGIHSRIFYKDGMMAFRRKMERQGLLPVL